MEHDALPRGRVVNDAYARQFILYADVHLLRNKRFIAAIWRAFRLPNDIALKNDEHYRCSPLFESEGSVMKTA